MGAVTATLSTSVRVESPSLLRQTRYFVASSKLSMPRGVKKENLPTKVCVTCQRPFTWRKKWEKCWDEVTTCSKSCNSQRRRESRRVKEPELKEGESLERTKDCAVCEEPKTCLFRCRWDTSKQWRFVCQGCWSTVSGRSSSREAQASSPNPGNMCADTSCFDGGNPHYQYG